MSFEAVVAWRASSVCKGCSEVLTPEFSQLRYFILCIRTESRTVVRRTLFYGTLNLTTEDGYTRKLRTAPVMSGFQELPGLAFFVGLAA